MTEPEFVGRPTWDGIDRWIEYLSQHIPLTARAVQNFRVELIDWLRQIDRLPL